MSKYKLQPNDALGVIICAAQARRDQYRTIGDKEGVEAATEELWDVGVTEAEDMTAMLTEALDVVIENRDLIIDQKRDLEERSRQVHRKAAEINEEGEEHQRRAADLSSLLTHLLADIEFIAREIDNGGIADAPAAVHSLRQLETTYRQKGSNIACRGQRLTAAQTRELQEIMGKNAMRKNLCGIMSFERKDTPAYMGIDPAKPGSDRIARARVYPDGTIEPEADDSGAG